MCPIAGAAGRHQRNTDTRSNQGNSGTDRSNEKYTLEDLAAMRLAVYGILEEKFRSKQEETNAPISRPEAVKLLYRTFSSKDSTVCQCNPTAKAGGLW